MSGELETVLRARGLRATPQRRFVLDALGRLGHGTPEQVWEQVQAVAPSLSASTVYRTLELLEQLGVVTHTHLGHGAPSYSLATHADHIHLVCRRCGTVQDADVTRAQQLAEEVAARHGFVADVGHLALDGLCARCATEATGTNPAS
ncbi:MAG TPA: transcriptional repressor [Kineosporiaceae bacterium]|jgi:Fur family ferric uptake transcriptional regulator|nr:transcriptional repressor [Kineosporiaceae bacterium]